MSLQVIFILFSIVHIKHACRHEFIHSLNKCLLRTHHAPNTVLGADYIFHSSKGRQKIAIFRELKCGNMCEDSTEQD